MIFRLRDVLEPVAVKVTYDGEPVSFDEGNIDALHKWIASMNKKTINKVLEMEGSRKYPLIWLAEGWKAKQEPPGVTFSDVSFYISRNSKIETLNKDRKANFEILYQVANDFIKELKKVGVIAENSVEYFERPSFNTVSKTDTKESITSDIWDTLIVKLELKITSLSKCF